MFYPSYDDYMRDIFYFNGLSNSNNYPYLNFNNQNLNDYYPSIYKIVNPVIQKVISGNNYQYTNEDSINNIVDVVFGIAIGDINSLTNQNNEPKKINQSGNNCQNNCSSNNTQSQENNNLLRDLIKILTIKELMNRNNVRRFPFTYGNTNYPQYFLPPYMMS